VWCNSRRHIEDEVNQLAGMLASRLITAFAARCLQALVAQYAVGLLVPLGKPRVWAG
jgi:hypothetical protein